MSKSKRRLAGLGGKSKIVAGHLAKGRSAEQGDADVAELKERLQREIVQRDQLVAEQVETRTRSLKDEMQGVIGEKETQITELRQEVEAAEARAWELQQQFDRQLEQAREGGAGLPGAHEFRLLDPDDFAERPMDSDEIRERDIREMADMILEQGLLQWPIVDARNRPLAGRRRSLAIRRIREEAPERYGELFPDGVPTIAMLEVDWDRDPLLADQEMLLMQHTQRRRDKPAVRDAKIRDLAKRMQQDPQAKWKGGRLGEGEYHALRRLSQLFGVSQKIVQRALADEAEESTADPYRQAHGAVARQSSAVERALADCPEAPPHLAQWRSANEALLAWLAQRQEG